jgi:D-alanyl-D-alanine carboxypeptidase
MPKSRQQLRRMSRIALLLALGTGLSQGASAIAGYMTGLDGRLLAVVALVAVSSLVAAGPQVLEAAKKNLG